MPSNRARKNIVVLFLERAVALGRIVDTPCENVVCRRCSGLGLFRNGRIRCPINDGDNPVRSSGGYRRLIPVVLHLDFELRM